MGQINQIVEGTVNNILDKKKELYEERIKICKECPLYLSDGLLGARCNSFLYLNSKTNTVSRTGGKGFKKGCGCFLKSKTRVKNAKCPLGKW